MFDVVCIGSATQDVFIKSDLTKIIRLSDVVSHREFLCYDYGSKVNIDNILFLTGGGASNTAVSFARLGLSAAFVGKVGKSDDAGAKVIGELKSEGVDVRFAAFSNTYGTGYSVILVSYEGDRTALTFRGANNALDETDIDPSIFAQTRWLYLSGLSGRAAEMAAVLARKARDHGVRIAMNPGSSQLKTKMKGMAEILALTDVLILNREEAELLTGLQSVRNYVDSQKCTLCGRCIDACHEGIFYEAGGGVTARTAELCKRCGNCMKACPKDAIIVEPWTYNMNEILRAVIAAGVRLVAVTDGRAGAQASDGRDLYFFPAYAAPTIDTLGAGDAFGSAFVAGIIRGEGTSKALQLGAANGSSVVRYFGAKPGLLARDEIEDFIKDKSAEEAYYVRTVPLDRSAVK